MRIAHRISHLTQILPAFQSFGTVKDTAVKAGASHLQGGLVSLTQVCKLEGPLNIPSGEVGSVGSDIQVREHLYFNGQVASRRVYDATYSGPMDKGG